MSETFRKAPPAEGLARNYARGFAARGRYTRQSHDDMIIDRMRHRLEDMIRQELHNDRHGEQHGERHAISGEQAS